MSFSFTDYFTHPQNIETLNNFINLYLKENKAGQDVLTALKEYYNEFIGTHFMFIPFFDTFVDYIINNNKLLSNFAEKLKLKNLS